MDMPKRTKKDKRPVAKIDFKPYGAAIKAGRTKQKESRNKAADALFISPRYLANIENRVRYPLPCPMKRFVKCFFELLTQIIVKVRKCKVQRVCVLHFQLAGSGGCFFLMKLYH